MKVDNEANFRNLWRELARATYHGAFESMADYKINLAKRLGIYNYYIKNECMAACPACYEAFKRAKVGMRQGCSLEWSSLRFPCSKCPLDWEDEHCEMIGTLYDRWDDAKTVKTARKYAKLISEMDWK